MNERIREIAERAEMAANKGDHVDVKLMMAKFAELIVRDCALTAGLMEQDGRKGIGAAILDNYGIE